MAAESSRKSSKSMGLVVRPQPVSDKSYVESVVGFINEVVPQTKPGEKEAISWVKFEFCDINDHCIQVEENDHNGNELPLLIILGYGNGIQVWCINANGDAQEVLSWRQGPVRVMRILPSPEIGPMSKDKFAAHRPLAALCDSTSAGEQFCYINFISLKSGERVDGLKYSNPVADIKCNKRVIVTILTEKIIVYDASNLKEMFCITSCYPTTSLRPNPVALGTRWLAFADRKLVQARQTCGGIAGEGVQSYTATVLNAAKTITKGLSIFGETVANSFSGHKTAAPSSQRDQKMDFDAGIVTVIDVMAINCPEIFREKPVLDKVNIDDDGEMEGVIAHFIAHANEPVAAIAFDPSGMLLLTSCCLGHNFNVFRIFSHPSSSTLGAVHHLYTLHRGDTTSKVQDIAFSLDSRWVAVSTLRGTTHIFPITPYGGQISARTHTSPRVVNKLSRFHRSAGLEDIQHPAQTGRNSPVLSGSPGSSSSSCTRAYDSHPSMPYPLASMNRMGNSRLPPYPLPITVAPLAQLKQSLVFPLAGTSKPKSPVKDRYSRRTPSGTENVCLAATFAPPRAWLVSSPSLTREKREKLPADSLYVIDWHGNLIEYSLHPRATGATPKADDSPIELLVSPHAQWNLLRPAFSMDIQPPLPNSNPLMHIQSTMTNTSSRDDRRSNFHCGTGTEETSRDVQESWLSEVEIITHAGPHRRLWMGPQFSFQTFQHYSNTTILSSTSSALLSQSPDNVPAGVSNIFTQELDVKNLCARPARSNPMEMPGGHQSSTDTPRSPLLIEASSGSFEQIPHLLEVCDNWPDNCSGIDRGKNKEQQLIEHIADAMNECNVDENVPTTSRSNTTEFRGNDDEELSSSSSQSGSVGRFDCGSSPHCMEHTIVFPTSNGSPDSS